MTRCQSNTSRPEDDPSAGPDVLLVEDQDADAALVCESLADNYDVRVVTDGGSAISTVRSIDSEASAPALIVLDLNLPQWSGFDVLAAARQVPLLESVPIVILSDSTAAADRERAESLGADRFVTKPMDIDALHREIEDIQQTFLRDQ